MSKLHYLMCGLDNVYLLNGFRYEETARGRRLRIENQKELHKAIGTYLIELARGLTGKELCFLREELNISQVNLARLLGESDQSVARREKRDLPYKKPPTQDRILRYMYEERFIKLDKSLEAFLSMLAEADNASLSEKADLKAVSRSISFEPLDGQWRLSA